MTHINIKLAGRDTLIFELPQVPRVGDQLNILAEGEMRARRVIAVTHLLISGGATQTILIATEPRA